MSQVPPGNQVEHSLDADIHGFVYPSVGGYQQLQASPTNKSGHELCHKLDI